MSILKSKIEGTEAEKTIAKEISKPWFKKIESWLSIVNIIALIINTILLLEK